MSKRPRSNDLACLPCTGQGPDIRCLDANLLIKVISFGLSRLDVKNLQYTCRKIANLLRKQSKAIWWALLATDFPKRSICTTPKMEKLFKENPKNLYWQINKPAKYIHITQEEFHQFIPFDYWEKELEDLPAIDAISKLTVKINQCKSLLNFVLQKEPLLLRGDMVRIKHVYDFFWLGNKFINERRAVRVIPKEFRYPEFPLDHYVKLGMQYYTNGGKLMHPWLKDDKEELIFTIEDKYSIYSIKIRGGIFTIHWWNEDYHFIDIEGIHTDHVDINGKRVVDVIGYRCFDKHQ